MAKLINLIICTFSFLQTASSRQINAPLLDAFDYIVVGGGLSGLTVANRLTEDPDVTVLVIEAGQADNYEQDIQVPVFVGADIYSDYDWYFETAPQTYLNGATRRIPQGRALGGGTILNAMLWNRGGRGDYNDWATLGNPGWGWPQMLPYFRKSETYTPVYDQAIGDFYGIHYDPAYHGFDGPVNVSFPKYFYNTSANFFHGLEALGVPIIFDPNRALFVGSTYLPLDIDPNNQTRADARRSYYDPYAHRENFYVSTGQYVTRVIFDQNQCKNTNQNNQTAGGSTGQGQAIPIGQDPGAGALNGGLNSPPILRSKRDAANQTSPSLRAIGVEYASDASAPRSTVLARREVIMAAGSLQTPKVLELSGIGSKSILEAFNITVLHELPGVGYNLQDHYLVGTYYQFFNQSFPYSNQLSRDPNNNTLNELAMKQYYANRTGPWTAGPADGNAFPSLSMITNRSIEIIAAAANQSTTAYLQKGLDPTIIAGYAAQRRQMLGALSDRNRAVIELINSNAGNISPSVMRPFSRGETHINSSDPFVPPNIDPRYGSNPIDTEILLESLLFNRLLLATPPMAELQPLQWSPPASADMDELREYVDNSIGTEYHPSGTCAMLPLKFGGVVDSNLLVYGTQNLRVIDASMFPTIPAAHLQAVIYGVAEKAADIIKAAKTTPIAPMVQTNSSNSCGPGTPNNTFSSIPLPPYANKTSSITPLSSGFTTLPLTSSTKAEGSSIVITSLSSMITTAGYSSDQGSSTAIVDQVSRIIDVVVELVNFSTTTTIAPLPPSPGPYPGYTLAVTTSTVNSPLPIPAQETQLSGSGSPPITPSAAESPQELPKDLRKYLGQLIQWLQSLFNDRGHVPGRF